MCNVFKVKTSLKCNGVPVVLIIYRVDTRDMYLGIYIPLRYFGIVLSQSWHLCGAIFYTETVPI